ncbi:MAG: putative Kinesin-II 95 kDa subunit, partial [Streblomastix strix]
MAETVTVAVRVRPLNSKEKAAKDTEIHKNTETTITITDPTKKDSKSFTFDYVYGTDSTQEQVYNDLGKLYLENAWAGFNCTLFAYGQTGSGKSYSMTGNLDPPDQKGIIPRGCEEMFNRITSGSDENVSFEVKASFLEMYNEKLQDLLDPKTTKTISIRESPTKGIYVENVVEQLVKSYKEIDKLITDGNKVRTVAATAMNATSSRSHSVLTIFFTRNEIISGKKTQKDSRVNLVDLAGSERQSQTESTGDRLAEACAINKSLSALGNVIAALVDQAKGKNTFVPYRDSLLTRMLQDSLGGNSKTIMIAAASPASSNYSETLSTLQFADRAKQIKNKPVVNESETDKLIRQLREEIEELKSQLIGDGSSGSSSQNNPESNPGIGGISPEEEEEFQKRQNEAEAELEKKRNELEQQYAAAAKEEQRLEAAREEYEKQMEELKSQGGTDVPGNQKLIEELAAKKAQLDAQQKALQDQIAKNNAAAEALAKKQLEIDQLRSQHEQEQDELIIAQKKLQDLQLTSSQKEKIAAEAKARREAYLSDLGLSITELGDAARADKDGPRLSNLSLSPDLCGALVYFLRPGEIFVGSAPQTGGATQFIVLQSLGVENIHCKITYDKNAKEVAIIPQGEKGRVLINDIWVEAERQVLVPGDRIIIGNNVVLRFIYDAIQRVNPNIDMEQQIELIQAELAVAHGKVNTVEEYIQKTRTMSWLLHADEIVDEANSIAQALGRRIFFGMDIHPEEKNVMVRVNSLEQGVVQEWDLNVLEKRLPMMRQMLHNQINSKNGSKLIPPLQNTYYG